MPNLFADLTDIKNIITDQGSKTVAVKVTDTSGVNKPDDISFDAQSSSASPYIDVVILPNLSPPVPRSQIQVAVSPNGQVTDEVLFEEAADASKKLYLPRYRLSEEIVSGQRRYRISLEPSGQIWNLIVYLEAYPADKLQEIGNAKLIDHNPQVILKYQFQGKAVESVFQEVTKAEGGQKLRAVLQLYTLEERDKIYLALTDAAYNTSLIVQRDFKAAIALTHSAPSNSTERLTPKLIVKGTENYQAGGQAWTRYLLSVTNWSAFPQELFDPAPDLPPCGLNKNSARTWVDIYAQGGTKLYGFCALSSPKNLDDLWFAVSTGKAPPEAVYIVLNDRRQQISYTSNSISPLLSADAGLFDKAAILKFNGKDSYVDCGNSANLNFGGQITIEAWIKPEKTTGLQNIVAHGHSPNSEIYLRIINNYYQIGSWDGRDYLTGFSIPAEDVGKWVHLAGLYDGTTWRLYRNGVEVSANLAVKGAFPVNENWAIGARGTGSERFFQGQISEVRIWNRSRSPEEIRRDMIRRLAGNEGGLVAYWPGNEGYGDKVFDKTANGNHGLLRGNVQWVGTLPETLYSQANYVLPDIVDDSFFFPTLLYDYIFSRLKPPSSQGINLIQRLVEWNGIWYSYYQDERQRDRFYYLPDSFQIGKRPESQEPTMSLQFQSINGTQQTVAKLEYYAAPIVNIDRLTFAATKLLQYAQPLPIGVKSLEFVPLRNTQNLQFRLALPGTEGLQTRNAKINLQLGIFDTLTLAVPDDFQAIWDAMFSSKQEKTLLTGLVNVEIAGGYSEEIPFFIRLQAQQEQIWNAIFVADVPAQYIKNIEVKTYNSIFAPPPTRPQDQIMSILVDFEGSDAVELNAAKLTATAKITLPISDLILHREDTGVYRYQMTVIRRSGQSSFQRETTMEILYPDVEV
ncbi:LamG domain-containing protein [Tolypothrix tenuis PCC 7101]|uniref:LamG domain-containing protein n=1 Tax=Tolypothrix tenuis PCC 7101 TaxID=231146 RepID=A0A1Z4N2B6_9CYAN|nr:LamG domain-containing protein [Aulosira sp. FACHB-113]BAY99866.1 LamG domain-containing protein [Tolypothrix tenuis PCC 7101]BAZ76212.1 LamG domain-containing protein [Aulosira laxa NIES-50]